MKKTTHHQSPPRGITASRASLALAAAAPLVLILTSGLGLQDSASTDVDGTRATLEKYVEIRKMISAERRDWALEQELLDARVDLVQAEIDQYRDRIAEIESNIGGADRKREQQQELKQQLVETSGVLAGIVAELEAGTRGLVGRLPEAAAERVALLSQQIPESVDQAPDNLGRRFQNVIGVLNELNRFNRTVNVFSELVVNSRGEEVEATTIHVGLGKAYYVSGNSAGVGPVAAEGPWSWEARNDAAEAVAAAVAIMNNERAAAFVQLPISLEIPIE